MNRRVIAFLGALALVVLAAAAFVFVSRAPNVSTVAEESRAASRERFPVISGQNLPGETLTLPADFAGDAVLVIVPFDEDQQTRALKWLPFARDLAAEQPGFSYYDVPVFPEMSAAVRTFVRAGMLIAIPDADLRARTILVFLDDRDSFLAALDIPNTDELAAFLLNRSGEILWRGAGDFTDVQGDELRAAVASAQ